MPSLSKEKFHTLFYIALFIKLIIAVFQVVGGVMAYLITLGGNVFAQLVSQQSILDFIHFITTEELTEDPRDFLANYLLHFAQTFSMTTLHFIAFYLIAHGLIKLWLIVGLLRKKLWYYPISIVIFCLFMLYQLYRFTFTHSPFLILLCIVDVFVIWLTMHEYKYLRSTIATDVKEHPILNSEL